MGMGVGYYNPEQGAPQSQSVDLVLGDDGIYRTPYEPHLLTSRVNASPIEQQLDEMRERTIHELREENMQLRAALEKLRAI